VLLQSKQLNLLQAYVYIDGLVQELNTLRSDSALLVTLNKANELSNKLGVDTVFPCSRKRKIPRRQLENATVSVKQSDVTDEDQARVDYFAVLDRLSGEVKERFPKSLKHVAPLQGMNMDAIDAEFHLNKLVEIYKLDENLIAQWRLFQ